MKKFLLLCVCLGGSIFVGAEKLPDNMYFRAMQDEMTRTLKQLKSPGSPRPFYVAYKLENILPLPEVSASLGALYPTQQRDAMLNVYTLLDIGTARQDSMGYAHDSYSPNYAYAPEWGKSLSKSYDGIRQALWETTDNAYLFASEVYQQKQAYKRLKNFPQDKPDFVPAKQARVFEPVVTPPSVDMAQLQAWAKEFSAAGNRPYVEQLAVSFAPIQKETYYLNSLGGAYQQSRFSVRVSWFARLRNQDGYKKEWRQTIFLNGVDEQTAGTLRQKNEQFLQTLEGIYHARKGETYLGPVLLTASAAGNFLQNILMPNLQRITPLLSARRETDTSAGKWRDKLGLRVLSNVIDVYDRPSAQAYNTTPLGGYMPVDDEGVAAQDLTLIMGGKLRALPRSSRPASKGAKSNGHARLTQRSLPRELLTNLFVEAKRPLSQEQLEQQLLAKCRALELEYCYILPFYPPSTTVLPMAQRIYTKDGHKEMVYGLKLSDVTPRSLRDVIAAGDTPEVSYALADQTAALPGQSMVTPALLLEELELVPDDAKPDKKPFVQKP